jgi:hypothetical protein
MGQLIIVHHLQYLQYFFQDAFYSAILKNYTIKNPLYLMLNNVSISVFHTSAKKLRHIYKMFVNLILLRYFALYELLVNGYGREQ